MAWEWSHTQEAYEAEWRSAQGKHGAIVTSSTTNFDERKYNRDLKFISAIPDDRLEPWIDLIWERAQEAATCDNGGWNAWMCPYGCGCHCVPFDPPDSTDSDE